MSLGHVALLAGLLALSWPLLVGGAAAMDLSLAAQGRGACQGCPTTTSLIWSTGDRSV